MRLPTTKDMVRALIELAKSGDLTPIERVALYPIVDAYNAGTLIELNSEQVEALDAMYSAYFGSTV